MQYAKLFHDHMTSSSGQEYFKGFTLYRYGVHLGKLTLTIYANLCSPSHGGFL